MTRVALVLAACAAPAPAPANHAPPAPPPDSACPAWVFDGPGAIVIRHDMFPGCVLPYDFDLPLCANHACPRPCSLTAAGGKYVEREQYDAAGRWSGWTEEKGGYSKTAEHCERVDGVIAWCNMRYDDGRTFVTTIDRDARGRIRALHYDDENIALAYDDAGHLTRMGDVAFVYDARGRLVDERFGDGTRQSYGYDTRGRLVDSVGRHLTYDERGRMVSASWKDAEVTYGYDARDRVVTMTEHEGDRVTADATWTYDCR